MAECHPSKVDVASSNLVSRLTQTEDGRLRTEKIYSQMSSVSGQLSSVVFGGL